MDQQRQQMKKQLQEMREQPQQMKEQLQEMNGKSPDVTVGRGGGQLLQLAASVRLALVHFLRVLQLPVLRRPQVLLLVQRLLV
jgi:hypothetical protein